jgi:hypothetical protein
MSFNFCFRAPIIYKATQHLKQQCSNTKPSIMHSAAPPQYDTLQSRSRVLLLPGELRNQILRYVVTQSEPLDLCNLRTPFNIDVSVMYVCKQLRDEARFFLYHENTLELGIESMGTVTSLHFSRHHSMCEYRAEEAVRDISSVFLERFLHFQFRFVDARFLGSLRRTISAIKHYFRNKHIKVILPPPKERGTAYQAATLPRVSLYPYINSPLSCFSLIRCASLSVSSPVFNYNLNQYKKLIELVTSNRPVLDMTREYEDAQCSARNVDRMLVPDGCFQDYERLGDQVFERLAAMCESANRSDQDAFLIEQEEFERCYREIKELQW